MFKSTFKAILKEKLESKIQASQQSGSKPFESKSIVSPKELISLIHNNIESLLSSNYSNQSNTTLGILTKGTLIKQKPNYTRSKLLVDIISRSNYYNLLTQMTNSPKLITAKPLERQKLITFCTIIELLNIAIISHDLINNDNTINNSNKTIPISLTRQNTDKAILLGDLIYTIAFDQMLLLNEQAILEHFAKTTQNMALAEAKICSSEINHMNCKRSATLNKQLISEKYWPLFNSIIFFCEFYSVEFDGLTEYVQTSFEKYLRKKEKGVSHT